MSAPESLTREQFRTQIRVAIGAYRFWEEQADALQADFFGRGEDGVYAELREAEGHRDDLIEEIRAAVPLRNQ